LVVQLTDALKEAIPSVSATVFFECQSIDGLVEHFLNKERELLRKLVGLQEQIEALNGSGARPDADRPAKVTLGDVRGGSHRTKVRAPGRAPRSSAGHDIAIIGLSGRYPQASNVEQYWENLKAGKNCVVEIPAERWSLEGFYCEDPEQAI